MKGNISQARINQQIRNMSKQQISYLKASPLQNDIYTWHFTIQGPQNSDFHQGLYHGHILLPFEYPFKPPDIVFLNKNGRFQTNTKICLTITQYHPQEWNSAWTIRTMLEAVISLFSQNVQGIGYEEGSPQQRRLLAKKSHNFKCEKCGLLKDILKPRESIVKKQQQKKQQQHSQIQQPAQKLEYAPELNLGKVKTQDNRKNSQKINQQSIKRDNQPQIKRNKKNLQSVKQNQQTQNAQKLSSQSILKIVYAQNDPIALDKYINKNNMYWAKVLKSQKWSLIQ